MKSLTFRILLAIGWMLVFCLASCQKESTLSPAPAISQMSPLGKEHSPEPVVPVVLQVPEGNRLAFHFHAEGVQIYTCNGTAWTFKAPEATLYNHEGDVVGKHYAGPTWELNNGSKVVGAKIASNASPDPNAIPWLLLQAASNSDFGRMSKVTYIQRLNTTDGKAPATGCDGTTLGQEVRIPYTADYYFYRAEGDKDDDENDDRD